MKQKKLDYREYPTPDATRGGCKVGWYLYRDHDAAKACAEAARHNARIQEGLGFDFGFQTPGNLILRAPGEWEVCIP